MEHNTVSNSHEAPLDNATGTVYKSNTAVD